MRSRFTRLKYSNIQTVQPRQSIRLLSAAGLCLALALTAACGGGSSDSNSDPTQPGPGNENPGDDDPGGGDPGGGNDGGGGNNASEIPLSELRKDLHATPADQRPPEFAEWESNIYESGGNIGLILNSNGELSDVYYDGQYVFMQISEYLGERQPWIEYAERAGDIYRAYVDRNDGQTSGYWRFSHGFYMDFAKNGDQEARDYLITMRDEPAFSDAFGPNGSKDSAYRGREIAYALQSQVMAEKAGWPSEEEELDEFVDYALSHIDIWTTGDWVSGNSDWQSWTPFMMGLNASALIDYYEWSAEQGEPDERVLPAIKRMADWLWREMWVDGADGSEYGAFTYRRYSDGRTRDPSGDLNMLVVPMYGWLYKETGEERFLRRGDEIFGGGVDLAWLGGGKQFNQNYRESFNYLRWRQEGLDRYGY